MKEPGISVASFDQLTFVDALARAASAKEPRPNPQILYLASYCQRLGAKTVVREAHYVDRHYLDEFALYYSRNFVPPPSHVERFHLFARQFDADKLDRWVTQALRSVDGRREVEQRLTSHYLGFISVRPLRGAPIGRTVLRKVRDQSASARNIATDGPYHVHLANLELRVDGAPFQQQDRAVGGCATASLWTALARVARLDGMRAPTPADVSEAAYRVSAGEQRAFPADGGLNVQQLCDAVQALGFAPETVRADITPETFVLVLHAYLRSGIPVVLSLQGTDGHAVTAVGFQLERRPNPRLETTLRVRSARVKKIYVHDDRIGPYARAFLEPYAIPEDGEWLKREPTEGDPAKPDGGEPAEPAIQPRLLEGLSFSIQVDGQPKETWFVDSAIAPVYPKLRLPVLALRVLAEALQEVVEKAIARADATRLNVEFYFKRGGDYLRSLAGRVPRTRVAELRRVALSRWVGIVAWFIDDEPFAEFVFDTTDILRDSGDMPEMLRAVVCLDPKYAPTLDRIAHLHGNVPSI